MKKPMIQPVVRVINYQSGILCGSINDSGGTLGGSVKNDGKDDGEGYNENAFAPGRHSIFD